MKTKTRMAMYRRGTLLAAALSLMSAATLWADTMEEGVSFPPSIATVQSAYGTLPLNFEANQGQTDALVQFLTRGRGHQLFLTPSEAVLTLRTGEAKADGRTDHVAQQKPLRSPSTFSQSVVRMKFAGADPQAAVVGLDPLPGIVNYLIGDDPSKWRTNIPTYQKVGYKDLYPGIDLVYYGNQGHLEYDLVVAPGADPTQIMLAFDGVEQIAVDAQGDLLLTLPQSSREATEEAAPIVRLHKPVVYQLDEQGEKHILAGSYALLAAEIASRPVSAGLHTREKLHVAFQVASYDASHPLIIDPILSWATYLGGSGFDDGQGIAVDTAGNAYVTGTTRSPNFPETVGSASQNTFGGGNFDAFVAKLNAAGTALAYATYLGGGGDDAGLRIAVDAAGQAYVTGWTRSSNFPGATGSAIQSTLGGDHDAFVAKLNAAGTALAYATYLGGSDGDVGHGIAVDVAGQAYVTGDTGSPNFPGAAGSAIQGTLGGYADAFVAKLNAAGSALVYATYLGGSDFEGGTGIAVDVGGHAYVTGYTLSPNFPGTAGSLIQSTFGGGDGDVFVAKLNAAGSALVYVTYLGSSDSDMGNGIAVDATGQAYVTGLTGSPNFPGTAGSAIQSTLSGGADAFVTKLNAAGSALVYSTYLGGSSGDLGWGIAVDAGGHAYVTGDTGSPNFPGAAGSAIQGTFGGDHDAFVAKLNAAGSALVYSTYLGGSRSDMGSGIAVDAAGTAYVTGFTESSNFPGTAGSAIQSMLRGFQNAFVAKISSSIPFAAFEARAKLDIDNRRHHGGFESHLPRHDDAEMSHQQRQKEEFELSATFTLGPGNNGLAPLTESMIIQVGTFSTAIPPRSFKQHKGQFIFEGTIYGVHLEAVLRSLMLGNDYELKVEGRGADLTGTKNPVTVSVTIGDDSGSKAITAKIK